jgi:hypothetical protein
MRVCSCGVLETEEKPFYKGRAICRSCFILRHEPRAKEYSKSSSGIKVRRKKGVNYRRNPKNRASIILKDSRRADKLRGYDNNLTRSVIESLISTGCQYCGATELKMTLDRMDNAFGHVVDNVVPCCIRCNYIRRDMPYEAWLLLIPSIRLAREQGLFGSWTCAIHNRNLESKAG